MLKHESLAIKDSERIFSIDVMRGLAIFGIFLVNMISFHSPFQYVDPSVLAGSSSDEWVWRFIDIFAQASFYPLFAFLFGYGLMIIKERAAQKGASFKRIGLRRMSFLLFFGVMHAFFIWTGDILITYAVLGFFLLLFVNLSAKTLAIIAMLIFFIPNGLLAGFAIISTLLLPELQISDFSEAARVTEIYQNGSFWEITIHRISEWLSNNGSLFSFVFLFISIFPLLLLGLSFAKSKRLEVSEINNKFFKKLLIFTLPIGLLMKLTPYLTDYNYGTIVFQDQLGGAVLTFAYISIVYLISQSQAAQTVFRYLSNVGKISLSNYLFQSIVCTFIFYGYGFGLYGQVSYTIGFILNIAIFIVQIILSNIWMKKYRIGPFEWVLRGCTYGKFSKIKRVQKGDTV